MDRCILCQNEITKGARHLYYCADCQDKMKRVKKMETLDKAKSELMQRRKNKYHKDKMLKIERSAENVRERIILGKDNFDSKKEVMIAIQLEHNGAPYESQKHIGDYRVDFVIPSLKVILEIDGTTFHQNEDASFLRDRRIMNCVGEKWEIVHISDYAIPRMTWKIDTMLPMIIAQRDENHRFRDTRSDTDFLEFMQDSMTGRAYR